jgi:hypothetical protein
MTSTQPPVPGAQRSVKVQARYLRAYLSDHLAVSAGIGSLAQRVRDASRWRDERPRLEALVAALHDDHADLERVLSSRGIKPDPLKRRFAHLAERLGRLKGNGRVFRSSPLTRVVELQGLQIGLHGCMAPWMTLRDLGVDPARANAALNRLVEQERRLDELRATVARSAFAD